MTKRDLVFLHGGSHGSWCWAHLFNELRKTPELYGRLIALDVPGCGVKRGRDIASLSPEEIIRELNDDLHALNVERAVLIGHSQAGALMPAMAVAAPELYSELVYVTTIAPAEGRSIAETMGKGKRGENPEQVGYPMARGTASKEEFLRTLFCQDLDEAQIAWLLSEAQQDATPIRLITEPISRAGYEQLALRKSYVVALRDEALPSVWQRRFAERLGVQRIVEIDTPHEPFISHPALLANTLRELLSP